MRQQLVPAICLSLCFSLFATPSFGQTADRGDPANSAALAGQTADAPAGTQNAMEQVQIVGQRPGPGLWKISKGDHTLWIFGTYSPLPKNMKWRSQQVETAIAQSQEYLAPPGAKAELGFFKGITLLPYLIGMRKNPDGAQLRDLLSPDQYARWTELKSRYMPENDDAERERPVFAAEALMRTARTKAGLVKSDAVEKRVSELVKQYKLKYTSSSIELPMDNARSLLKNFKKTQLNDVACLANTMDKLESEIAYSDSRAAAWATGNLDEIRKLDFAEREQACFENIVGSAVFDADPAFKNMHALMLQKWLAAAENALTSNSSTFAVLQIKEILDPKGVIAALAAKGYTIGQPE
jgi:uncharacterized protein YbaP (TraB family)